MISTMNTEIKKRLIVMIPDCLAGNPDLAHKVYWMAIRDQSEVHYLILVDDEEKMLTTARYMATMKAMTAGNFLVVHSGLVETSGWLKTLREIYRPGDRVICCEEQFVKSGFLQTLPIKEFLQDALNVPVITVSGFYHPQQIQLRRWFGALIAWLGFLLILTLFTGLEIQFDHVFHNALGKVYLAVLFTVEIAAIWTWNRITGH